MADHLSKLQPQSMERDRVAELLRQNGWTNGQSDILVASG
jgi:hypothetical protein